MVPGRSQVCCDGHFTVFHFFVVSVGILCQVFCISFTLTFVKITNTTSNGGSLGSRVDEDRSKAR